jgi:hypothetical protein
MVPSDLLTAAKTGVIPYDLLRKLARDAEVTPAAVIDGLAVFVATQYSEGAMAFEEADTIMNASFAVSISEEYWAENDRTIPHAMYEVYEAFDAGEYHHHGDASEVDPELKYTKPLVEKFLSMHRNGA